MKLFFKPLLALIITISLSAIVSAQPFIKEINYFKKLDSLNAPPQDPILFIGSSSFTNWKDVNSYFPTYNILNRAFGGSSLEHLVLYANDIIFKYHPRQIVIYCGENNLSAGPDVTGASIAQKYIALHQLIRSRLPKVPIVYISMKPSPSREKYLPVMTEGNRLIKKYLRKQRRSTYVDVFSAMFTKDGAIMPDIFLSDKLHMNKKGYEIWQPIIQPYLLK
ncbi:MAG TPA: GDSL-type esterase/lipase family protein [Sediminibacterium sp.]|nr:GDSL-type esterase/lipase family protein [Sediminibacterium sp.]